MARLFNGTSDVLATTGSPSALNIGLNAPFSFCGWVNFQGTLTPAAQATLFGKGFDGKTAWTFYLTTASNLSFGCFDGALTHGCFIAMGTLGWTLNTWHHVYGDYTGTTWRMWADGIHQTGQDSIDGSGPISNTAKFEAGAVDASGSPAQFGNLSLADVAVFNAPLTGTEILALGTGTARPNTGMSQTLLGYWKMDASSPAADQSGNANDLIVTGTTVVADPAYPGPTTFVLMGQICA